MPISLNIISETAFSVQGHGVHTAFIEAVEAFTKMGLNVKTNSSEPADIMHLHTVGPYALWKCLRNSGKTVITAHVIPDSFVGSIILADLWRPLASAYLKFFYGLADTVIAVSPTVKSELEKMGIAKRIVFIPNAVNPEKFKRDQEKRKSMREKLSIGENDFVVMNSGQIQPRKGIATFVQMARELPEMKFVWIGDMPFKHLAASYSEMQQLKKDAPANVIFTGIVPYEEMPAYYNAGDVFFFPSYQENFPFSVIEAAASRLPLLLRDVDLYLPIFDGAYLKGDESTFHDQLLKLKEDRAFYEESATKTEIIVNKYNSTAIANQIVEIYKELLTPTPAQPSIPTATQPTA